MGTERLASGFRGRRDTDTDMPVGVESLSKTRHLLNIFGKDDDFISVKTLEHTNIVPEESKKHCALGVHSYLKSFYKMNRLSWCLFPRGNVTSSSNKEDEEHIGRANRARRWWTST